MTHNTSTIRPLMVKFRMLDKSRLTPRDVLILWCIIENPGIRGTELTEKLGLPTRSAIQNNLPRLIREGMIEDRRLVVRQTVPNILYATPQGVQFFNDIVKA